ncbi:MAG: hypothetical protein M3O20_07745 [Acidobacteriota bacterium]|nr:hypothetical protein [Acidobacteriota bacterium]
MSSRRAHLFWGADYRRVMVTEALAFLVLSATLVTVTVAIFDDGKLLGALYNPLVLIVPGPVTFQVTLVLLLPWTVALNC